VFLHPWAIVVGALGIGLPVFIHWLTRPRPIRLPLSTIRFVQEIVHQRRARNRLRDWLVLALRTLAVLLIAFAFARPLVGERPLVSDAAAGEAVRVVVLDVSQSMGAVDGGVAVLERARAVTAEHLRYRSGLRAALIFAAAKPRSVLDAPTANTAPLREELSRVAARPERFDPQEALAAATRMLSTDVPPGERRELVIISDFQKNNWSSVNFAGLPQDTRVQLESVAPRAALSNLAILRASVRGRAQQGRDAAIEVEVGNFSATARELQAEARIGDAAMTLRGVCSPEGSTLMSATLPLSGEGWQPGSIRLVGVEDALGADNVRHFVANVRRAPTFVLITREPVGPARMSSYFLSRALDPSRPGESRSGLQLVRTDPAQLDREQLNAAEFILLDHPGRLAPENVRLLASLLRRGRSMLYVCGEAIDATNLKLLAEAAPELKLPVEFAPASSRRVSHAQPYLRLVDFRRSDPPFSAFGDSVIGAIAPLRFSAAMTSKRAGSGVSDEVLAAYDDGSALLVRTSCGQGEIAILNADLSESNLPTTPLFVPLVHEMVQQLTAGRKLVDTARSGEPLSVYLPAEPAAVGQLRITRWSTADAGEKSEQDFGELVEESSNVLWRWGSAGRPGVYRVEHRDNTVYALATAIPEEESELESIAPALLQGQTSGRQVQYRTAADQAASERDDRWSWLAAACVVCMLGEIVVLRVFKT
jgi:hypothetical protein